MLSRLRSLVFIDPVWLIPVVVRDNTKLHLGVGHQPDTPRKVAQSARLSEAQQRERTP